MSQFSQRVAAILAHVTLLGAILLPVMAAGIWLFWDTFAPAASGNLQHAFNLTNLGIGARLAGFGIFLIGALIAAFGLLGLRRTFQEAAQGRPLSTVSVYGFRRYAWVTLAMVFFGVAQRTGLIMLFSINDPAHQGAMSVQLGTPELQSLFMAIILIFVAHVFAEGQRATAENEAFL